MLDSRLRGNDTVAVDGACAGEIPCPSAPATVGFVGEGIHDLVLLGGEGWFGDRGDERVGELEVDVELDAGPLAFPLERPLAVEIAERAVRRLCDDGQGYRVGDHAA